VLSLQTPQPNLVEYIATAELWKTAKKECKTERCKKLARRILTSSSLREAIVYFMVAATVDAAEEMQYKLSDSDVQELVKIIDGCVTDNIVQQMVVASFLEDNKWAHELMDIVFECIENRVTKTYGSD